MALRKNLILRSPRSLRLDGRTAPIQHQIRTLERQEAGEIQPVGVRPR